MKLASYVKKNKSNLNEFSAKIGVARWSLERYLAGRLPAPEVMVAIHKATKGEVDPNSFYNLERKR